MDGLDSSSFSEGDEPVLGGMAIPVGGRGAGFFLVSDWTRASQGGSFSLGVSLALLDLRN